MNVSLTQGIASCAAIYLSADADPGDASGLLERGKMGTHPLDDFEDAGEDYASEVPEDVAILYSWANLQGARYRDFSANRREHRAQMRKRAAEQMRQTELEAQSEAEAAANQAELAAAAAHAQADAAAAKVAARLASQAKDLGGHAWLEPHATGIDPNAQEVQAKHASMRIAAQQARKAAVAREESVRRAGAAAFAESSAIREQDEIAEAQASAFRQASRYAEASLRNRTPAGADEQPRFPGNMDDPYSSRPAEYALIDQRAKQNPAKPAYDLLDTDWGDSTDGMQDDEPSVPLVKTNFVPANQGQPGASSSKKSELAVRPHSVPKPVSRGERSERLREESGSHAEVVRGIPNAERNSAPRSPAESASEETSSGDLIAPYEVTASAMSELYEALPVRAKDAPGPAWLYPRQQISPETRSHALVSNLTESLYPFEHSGEQTAARWFALRGVFTRHEADGSNERPVARAKPKQAPIVAIYSVAGGVGKTSLVATLGRALSFLGERILLSDTTAHGLLPFYFGASQPRPEGVRTFSPPAGNIDPPIQLVSYDGIREDEQEEGQAGIVDDLLRNGQRANRVLMDLGVHCSRMLGRLRQFKPTVLVPLLADMNSVISIDAVEKLFSTILDANGSPLQPVYLLNQFDTSLTLHLDIREVLLQQLGDRLLPFVIRRSPVVSEALAEGMTIVDYDPGSAIAEDYMRVANWLRSVSAPVAVGSRHQRWSEQ